MSLITELENSGFIDSKDALSRLMNKTVLYEKVLKKFPNEAKRADGFISCLEAQDYTGAYEAAHTLKGVTGNLSITPLYNGYSEISALLKGDSIDPVKAKEVFEALLPIQNEIIACIEKNS